MSRCCSQCGTNGHNSRTCGEPSSAVSGAAMNGGSGNGGGEIMLFGVRVKVDPMRKSVSMNNLSQYEQPPMVNQNGAGNSDSKNSDESEKAAADDAGGGGGGGYVSADDAVQHQSTGGRERKRGIPWTEEEHKLFLLGLQNVGKGDWRGISRNFVKTRTPTQVASHAQKYYLRKTNLNRRRRRSSLFDITTDSVPGFPIEDGRNHKEQTVLLPTSVPATAADASNMNGYTIAPFPMAVGPILVPVQVQNSLENKNFHWGDQVQNGATMLLHPFPVIPVATSSASTDINRRGDFDPSALSLRLSLSSEHSQSSTRQSSYKAVANFSNGDSIVAVA